MEVIRPMGNGGSYNRFSRPNLPVAARGLAHAQDRQRRVLRAARRHFLALAATLFPALEVAPISWTVCRLAGYVSVGATSLSASYVIGDR